MKNFPINVDEGLKLENSDSLSDNSISQLATCINRIYINETTFDHYSAADIVMRGALLMQIRLWRKLPNETTSDTFKQ